MYFRLARRLLTETDFRLLRKLAVNAGLGGLWSVVKHRRRLRRGRFFPPFLYISVINSCNLRCQGCWVDVAAKQQKIELDALDRLITDAKAMGNRFFGILGGEPFLHKDLLEIFHRHGDCYFQVFTNGHFLTDEVCADLRKAGNVTPLVSVEGSELISDERRGRPGVFSKTMQGVETAIKHRLMVGVCTSLCQTNYQDLLNEDWVDRLIEMGVMYTWFHIYRPVGPEACPDLALTPSQQKQAREFVVNLRVKKPIIVIDAYYDADGRALCPAATGFTHHISPWGDVEPCPIIQIATDSIHDARPIGDVIDSSEFLADFRRLAAEHTRGCIVLERPDVLAKLKEKHTARDTTARQRVDAELAAMTSRPSQYDPGSEVRERSWAYWIAKKIAFHDYGVYGQHFDLASWHDPRSAAPLSEGARPATALSGAGSDTSEASSRLVKIQS